MKIISDEKVVCSQLIATKLGLSTSRTRELMEILKNQGLLKNYNIENYEAIKCGSCSKTNVCTEKSQINGKYDPNSLIITLK